MATNYLAVMGPVVANDGTSTFTCGQVSNRSDEAGLSIASAHVAGDPEISWKSIMQQLIGLTFDSTMIQTWLSKFTRGACAVKATGGAFVWIDFYFTVLEIFNDRAVSATHHRSRMNSGMLTWRSITASDGEPASMAIAVQPVWDGTNNPFIGSLASRPANMSITEMFTLGPSFNGGTEIGGVTKTTINSNIKLKTKFGDGNTYPTYCAVETITPTIDITTLHNGYTLLGYSGQPITNFKQYLRKCILGQTTYAAGSNNHLQFMTRRGLLYCSGASAGGENSDATWNLRAEGAKTDDSIISLEIAVNQPIAG